MEKNEVKKRLLSANERADMVKMLTTGTFPGVRELLQQVPAAAVAGGIPTLLDLTVEAGPRSGATDGPIPGRWVVEGLAGDLEGELLIWVKDGFLDGLEFAWLTDEPPGEFPPPERVRKLPDDEA